MIRWKRANDGFVKSHDGVWEITPEYWSCVKPQAYTLWRDGKKVSYNCATQRDAKESAQAILWRETKK